MIGAYRDDCGFVGEAPRLPAHAEDVQDASRRVSNRLAFLAHEAESLIEFADNHTLAVDDDPDGYTLAHVKAWDAIETQLAAAEDAVAALRKMVLAA